jgi:hypothetical protein
LEGYIEYLEAAGEALEREVTQVVFGDAEQGGCVSGAGKLE